MLHPLRSSAASARTRLPAGDLVACFDVVLDAVGDNVAQASLQLGKMGSWAAFADRYLEIMNYSMDLTSRMTDAGLLGQAAPATGLARKEA
ncbi:hypothetical protein [uncultured Caulobacter sp.]|uniref:hypothetical protein n=1 Tax=uncultured Caulobacter sp. TaxID=158749 RepID=UPI00261E470F|nr:hypothetical protein [uncultured Caulobacter sp.]